jgi:hypothetical protein
MAVIVTLVTIMTINGQDFERQEQADNLEQCWRMAAERMEQMLAKHAEIDKIGIGCVVNRGKDL